MAINNYGPESRSKVVMILATGDIDQAVTYTHQALLPNALTTRILVHASIHHIFLQTLLDAIEEASQNHVPDIDTIPEITDENLQHVHDLAASARDQGANVVTGGIPPVRGNLGGFFERPTVVDGVRPEMGLFREVVTGPLATVTTFDEDDEAILWMDEILVGAEVVVFSGDEDEARRFAAAIQSGNVSVNGEAVKR